jgi:hypothetical protein
LLNPDAAGFVIVDGKLEILHPKAGQHIERGRLFVHDFRPCNLDNNVGGWYAVLLRQGHKSVWEPNVAEGIYHYIQGQTGYPVVLVREPSNFRQFKVYNQPCKFIENTQILYVGKETVRKSQASFRMHPADKGFESDDVTRSNVDLRLIVKHKFIAFDGASQLVVIKVDSRVLLDRCRVLPQSMLSQQILQFSRSEWLVEVASNGETVSGC